MASVHYAMEKYRNATRVLATRPGRVKQRLADAVLEIMDCQDCVPIIEDWCNVREENRRLWRRLNARTSAAGEPDILGCIEMMTEDEASAVADAIYTVENKLRATYDSSG